MALTLQEYNLKFNNCYLRNYTETLTYYLGCLTLSCYLCILIELNN